MSCFNFLSHIFPSSKWKNPWQLHSGYLNSDREWTLEYLEYEAGLLVTELQCSIYPDWGFYGFSKLFHPCTESLSPQWILIFNLDVYSIVVSLRRILLIWSFKDTLFFCRGECRLCPFLTERHCCVYFTSSVQTHSPLCEFFKYYMLPISYTYPPHFLCSGHHQ